MARGIPTKKPRRLRSREITTTITTLVSERRTNKACTFEEVKKRLHHEEEKAKMATKAIVMAKYQNHLEFVYFGKRNLSTSWIFVNCCLYDVIDFIIATLFFSLSSPIQFSFSFSFLSIFPFLYLTCCLIFYFASI